MPSPKAIEEFKELYFHRYGVRLPDAEAMEQGGILLRLYKTVYGNLEMGTTEEHEKALSNQSDPE